MPPDEYHSGVDNSVYTNVLLRNRSDLSPPQPQHAGAGVPELQPPLSTSAPSLRFAAALARDLGQPVPSQWLEVADRIKVPFDPKHSFHPEFDGYEPGEWTRNPSRAPSGLSQDLVPALDSPAPRQQHLSPRRGGEAGRRRAPGVPRPLLHESSCSQKKPGGLRGCDVPPWPCHDLGEETGEWGGSPHGGPALPRWLRSAFRTQRTSRQRVLHPRACSPWAGWS